MLRPEYAKWDQTPEDLLHLSMEAENQRSRERYLALYMIGTGQSNATDWATPSIGGNSMSSCSIDNTSS